MPEVLVTKLPSSLKRQISGEISCEGQRQTRISDIVSDFGGYSFFLSVLILYRRMGSQSLLVDMDQYVTERQGLRLERSSDLGGAL